LRRHLKESTGANPARSRRRVAIVTPIILAIAMIGSQAPAAMAAKGAVSSFGGKGTEGGKFGTVLEAMAVNQAGSGGAAAGDIYVTDTAASRIQQFSPAGEFIRAFGLGVGGSGINVCTVAPSCVVGAESGAAGAVSRPRGIAVDQATGVVYVGDIRNERVSVFSATGVFEGAFGWNVKSTGGAEELQLCTTVSGCQQGKAGAGAGQFGPEPNVGPAAIAVSPLNGHIFTADSQNRRINEFAPVIEAGAVTGVSFVRGYGWGAKTGAGEFQICTVTCHAPGATGSAKGQFSFESPQDLAIDASGTLYAVDSHNERVQTFDAVGNPLGNFAASTLSGNEPLRIAIDPSSGHVFVMAFPPGGRRPYEFDAAGTLLEIYFPGGGLGENGGIATGPGEQVYVPIGPRSRVYRLGTIVPPTAEIETVATPTGTSAEVKSKINPKGLEGTYRIEFSTDEGANWTVKATGEFPADEIDHQIVTTIGGLEALTKYQVRIVAEKVFKSGSAEDSASFETPASPPVIGPAKYSGNSDTCVQLEGAINPENQETTYEFEYVTETQFAEDEFAQAIIAPPGGATIASGPASVPVAQQVCGLVPRTTYHFRLSAQNATGPAVSAPATFTTFSTATLGPSDERAYEQASPVDKNGADIQTGVNSLQTSPDGNAVTFFANAGLPGGEGAQEFPIFMARRNQDGSGWSTQGLLPPASAGPQGFVNGWTDDLNHAYASGWTPGSPTSFFERDTATRTIKTVATDAVSTEGGPDFAGAAEGGSAVLFEDTTQILPKAVAGKSNVYLWDAATGVVVLASVMNDGQAPAEGAFAGPYDWFVNRDTTLGGSAEGYYTYESNALSRNLARVYFTVAGSGQLYVRTNPLQPQSPVDGGGKCLDSAKACTVRVSRSHRAVPDTEHAAAFLGATSDGSKAIFSSTSALTENANTGPSDGGRDLYMYDAAADELIDLTPKAGGNGAEVRGILGYSNDASYIYFVANGVLAPGATLGTCADATETAGGSCNVYLWHEGTITFVAPLAGPNATEDARDWAPTTIGRGHQPEQRGARVSADGKTLLLRSQRKLSAYDNEGKGELYRYAADQAQLSCVSCSPTNTPPAGGAGISNIPQKFTEPARQAALSTRNMSANGRRLFFDTPDKLLSSDTNGVNDVYEWEAKGEGSCESESENGGCLYLISTGTSPQPSYFVDASTDGSNVFILTSQPLVAQDRDELVDVYDARVHGGIPSQNVHEPVPCVGEACAGAVPSVPATQAPATPKFVGPGNPKPLKCKKGFRPVKKHGKTVCAKVKHKKGSGHKKHQRNGGKG
jgi:hypothetical protein